MDRRSWREIRARPPNARQRSRACPATRGIGRRRIDIPPEAQSGCRCRQATATQSQGQARQREVIAARTGYRSTDVFRSFPHERDALVRYPRANTRSSNPGPPARASLACAAMYASHVLPAARAYGVLYRSFRWQIPPRYNIAVDVCDRWAEIDPARTAIFNLVAARALAELN